MAQQIDPSLIRILNDNGELVGAGFLVTKKLAITCSHVIELAGGAPGQAVHIIFQQSGTSCDANVDVKTWYPIEDVAFLHLPENLPDSVFPLPLGSSRNIANHPFQTFGFPDLQPVAGLSGAGEILGETTSDGVRKLQLRSQEVTVGFSGAPVWDTAARRVVGMITSIAPPDRFRRQSLTAFATPSETLRSICPTLIINNLCPYLSLDAFTETDVEFFFGRQRVVNRLLSSLRRQPRFLAVLGPSGSGKSSLVQAGLIPQLREGKIHDSEQWGILITRPATQPFDRLASAGLSGSTRDLLEASRSWLQTHSDRSHLVLVVDQFEEILVACPEQIQQEFVNQLTTLLTSNLQMTLVLVLRDAFYSRFAQRAPALVPWLEQGLVNVPPLLTADELIEMIRKPADAVGLEFEANLVQIILKDTLQIGEPESDSAPSNILPLLEFTLAQLWKKRHDGLLTYEDYQAIGRVTGGLTQWAENAYWSLSEDQRPLARQILTRLVDPGDKTQGIPDSRCIRSLADLSQNDEEQRLIEYLANARLIVIARDVESGQETVELIHEALLQEWARMKGWLEEDHHFLVWRREIEQRAQAWIESKDEDTLLHGTALADAESWLDQRGVALGEKERAFIHASLLHRRRERLGKIIRWSLTTAVVVIAITITTLGVTGQLRRFVYKPPTLVWGTIPAGEFLMGSDPSKDPEADNDEQPQHEVYLDEYQIAAYEVTYSQYTQCVRAGICDAPSNNQYAAPEIANYPVAGVSWHDAWTFCAWVGGRLPTEAEWEKAARGGLEGMPYPWGYGPPDCTPGTDNGAQYANCSFWSDAPVGTFKPNGFGLYDMAGNVWEWVNDWYSPDYYSVSPTSNPPGPENGDSRVLRGGSYSYTPKYMRTASRYGLAPSNRSLNNGFRCARSP